MFENPDCQLGQHRKHEFATSINYDAVWLPVSFSVQNASCAGAVFSILFTLDKICYQY
jgi:hypothetical protein